MPLGIEVGLIPGDFVFDGDPAPSQTGGGAPNFRAVYCGETAEWIKMPLGTEVGLGPDDIVLDGGPSSPPQKGGGAPHKFSAHVHCDQTAGWIKMVVSTEVGLSPGDFILDGDPAPSPKRGRCPLLNFRPNSIVAKRLNESRCHLV